MALDICPPCPRQCTGPLCAWPPTLERASLRKAPPLPLWPLPCFFWLSFPHVSQRFCPPGCLSNPGSLTGWDMWVWGY